MSAFQIAGLSLIAFVVLLIGTGAGRGQLRKRVAAFWILVWCGGALALAWPGLTVRIARALGVGRGTDLLLYCTVLATTWGFFWVYTRMRRVDRQLTQLVRQLAIKNAEPAAAKPPSHELPDRPSGLGGA
jgi:hypothetical protein